MGWDGASWGPKGWGWDKKIFPVMWGETEMGKTKSCGARAKSSSFGH